MKTEIAITNRHGTKRIIAQVNEPDHCGDDLIIAPGETVVAALNNGTTISLREMPVTDGETIDVLHTLGLAQAAE
ncbi:hypothetical protein [Telmatospirillum sp. J64-1]|uniref:hypothetical protein n=1 Tax=Telmatospirillum sp. J64-1 TaxID=2502183 RepID=UPI00115DAA7C|nr:hypothetical protein [Telmatospirillum sp. J64-1]